MLSLNHIFSYSLLNIALYRAISMVYNALEARQNEDFAVHISYMEIYQETGYDLLNPAARAGFLVTAPPKVDIALLI